MRKCMLCKDKFKPKYFLQKHCMERDECIKAEIELKKATIWKEKRKEWNKEKSEIKEKLKTHSDWIQDLQTVFNKFIRLRDKDLPCISCQTTKTVEYAAGHFYPTTYQFLRFNEDNVHKQCNKHCNMMLRGNLQEYRPALIKKIGIERVEALDNSRHKELEISIPELKDLITHYKQKIKKLQAI